MLSLRPKILFLHLLSHEGNRLIVKKQCGSPSVKYIYGLNVWPRVQRNCPIHVVYSENLWT